MKHLLLSLSLSAVLLPAAHAQKNAMPVPVTAPLDELVTRLGAADVGSRYDAQMQILNMAATASAPGNDARRAEIAAAFAARASDAAVAQPARVWLVRQLEHMGRGEAVPALTALLNGPDAELREGARRALQKNSDPAAADSLRAALEKGGDASWKTGLAFALGEKRDPASVPLIAPLLQDPKTGLIAAKALGAIATPAAVSALWSSFAAQPASAAEGLLSAAQRDPAQTAAIAGKLFAEAKPAHLRAAALALYAKADPAGSARVVAAALAGPDLRLQKAAVDASTPAALAAALPGLPATAKVHALRVIEDGKAALACATDADESVRIAALEALGRVGGADSVPVLLAAATKGSDPEKAAAAAALAVLKGDDAGAAVEKQAAAGDFRAAAITALGQRMATSAVPALLGYAGEAGADVGKAALQAVARMGGADALDGLVSLVLAGKAGAKDALVAVSSRIEDKSKIGGTLAARAKDARGAELTALLDVMALVGGPEGLQAVVGCTQAADEASREGAIRALCNWREFPGAEPLLKIAADAGTKPALKVLALQGVCRLVKTSETAPPEARVAAALAALKAAPRPQEKTQAVSALAAVTHRSAADALIPLLADAEIGASAAQGALSLGNNLWKPDRGSAKRLAEAVKKANPSPDLVQKADDLLNRK
ncbi:MAG: HEAT repeat domain-containing protein [Kiritimatiellia bacterium]